MTDTETSASQSTSEMHRATAIKASRLSPIWIVPIVAILIGVWLVYDSYLQRGPLVKLTISTAEGIEAGKTSIKTRNVEIGQVESVTLSKDLSQAVIYARLTPEAASMLVSDSRFWVVKPRIGREGISGLNTVLSGAYIRLQPGQSDVAQQAFEILDQPPVDIDGNGGLRLNLTSQLANSLRVGDPVLYQGYLVGRVEQAQFDRDTLQMHHRLFIESPYDELVTQNTRFWSAKGFSFNLTSAGVELDVASLEALISGGVAFGLLDNTDSPAPPAQPEQTFVLYADEEHARQGSFDRHLEYVLLVRDTVRGLINNAPVEYRGIRIGTVVQVPWEFTSEQRNAEQGYDIPVLIRLEPQRLDPNNTLTLDAWQDRINSMIENGLRASLRSGNLLTGALFVDLNFQQGAPAVDINRHFENVRVIPTTPTGLAQLEQKVSSLLDKLNALQVEPLLSALNSNLNTSQAMLAEMQTLVADIRQLINDPALQSSPEKLNNTLDALHTTLQSYDAGAPAYEEITNAIQRMEKLLRDLQPAARSISEQPSRLLFDQPTTTDPTPRAPVSGDTP
ncbi:Paraquat-inducible protein B [Methylophaga frappieri]|uniref:Paraquat-inducible protein B n=1 Tax=Methylophaga frappieri (strain ATCC BAA-2434 / DSM 25690 / JAM7) TaxID=754477 RepID=I1YFY9_METFJ|nr:intermembrane transport protein PqiB [Methylophaga frappieri]AFJ01832.1 Paraquat-inducible protein B [Methylophaga frappieri]